MTNVNSNAKNACAHAIAGWVLTGTALMERLLIGTALAGISMLLIAHPAHALPVGGQIEAGTAAIATVPLANTMNITQTTNRAVINWNSFDIAAGEHVNFIQPSSQAIALNRVTGSQNPSQILGSLSANGHVWIINPNGVIFGQGAQINVAGIIASTANISTNNFMNGNYQFDIPGNPNATIRNAGHIIATEAGLTALVGPNVSNTGVIQATVGKVQLGSAETFTVDLYGDGLINLQASPQLQRSLSNSGTVISPNTNVLINVATAQQVVDNLINLDGIQQATNITTSADGSVTLSAGGDIAVANDTTISTNATVAVNDPVVSDNTVTVNDTAIAAPDATTADVTVTQQASVPFVTDTTVADTTGQASVTANTDQALPSDSVITADAMVDLSGNTNTTAEITLNPDSNVTQQVPAIINTAETVVTDSSATTSTVTLNNSGAQQADLTVNADTTAIADNSAVAPIAAGVTEQPAITVSADQALPDNNVVTADATVNPSGNNNVEITLNPDGNVTQQTSTVLNNTEIVMADSSATANTAVISNDNGTQQADLTVNADTTVIADNNVVASLAAGTTDQAVITINADQTLSGNNVVTADATVDPGSNNTAEIALNPDSSTQPVSSANTVETVIASNSPTTDSTATLNDNGMQEADVTIDVNTAIIADGNNVIPATAGATDQAVITVSDNQTLPGDNVLIADVTVDLSGNSNTNAEVALNPDNTATPQVPATTIVDTNIALNDSNTQEAVSLNNTDAPVVADASASLGNSTAQEPVVTSNADNTIIAAAPVTADATVIISDNSGTDADVTLNTGANSTLQADATLSTSDTVAVVEPTNADMTVSLNGNISATEQVSITVDTAETVLTEVGINDANLAAMPETGLVEDNSVTINAGNTDVAITLNDGLTETASVTPNNDSTILANAVIPSETNVALNGNSVSVSDVSLTQEKTVTASAGDTNAAIALNEGNADTASVILNTGNTVAVIEPVIADNTVTISDTTGSNADVTLNPADVSTGLTVAANDTNIVSVPDASLTQEASTTTAIGDTNATLALNNGDNVTAPAITAEQVIPTVDIGNTDTSIVINDNTQEANVIISADNTIATADQVTADNTGLVIAPANNQLVNVSTSSENTTLDNGSDVQVATNSGGLSVDNNVTADGNGIIQIADAGNTGFDDTASLNSSIFTLVEDTVNDGNGAASADALDTTVMDASNLDGQNVLLFNNKLSTKASDTLASDEDTSDLITVEGSPQHISGTGCTAENENNEDNRNHTAHSVQGDKGKEKNKGCGHKS